MNKTEQAGEALDVLALFRGIRRAPGQQGDYAPHKPLMLLLALSRVQHDAPRLTEFSEAEPDLKALLTEFAKSGSASNRHLPFWRLKNDLEGRIWQVQDASRRCNTKAVDPPTLSALRDSSVCAGFTEPVYKALRKDPGLVIRAAQDILSSNFPDSLHEDIAQALGLELSPVEAEVQDSGAGAAYSNQTQLRRRRDPAFREAVLRAYEYRCCVCGFDLRVNHHPIGLEAAHIQWHVAGGPDQVPNGLSLCALHHKLFDLGAFTVEPQGHRVLYSQHAIAGDRGLTGEMKHHGQPLLAPQQAPMKPAALYLAWNLKYVFKSPARSWEA